MVPSAMVCLGNVVGLEYLELIVSVGFIGLLKLQKL